MRRCLSCGSENLLSTETEVDFDSVAMVPAIVIVCQECGGHGVSLKGVEKLMQEIARQIASQERAPTPNELRFLRKFLEHEAGS